MIELERLYLSFPHNTGSEQTVSQLLISGRVLLIFLKQRDSTDFWKEKKYKVQKKSTLNGCEEVSFPLPLLFFSFQRTDKNFLKIGAEEENQFNLRTSRPTNSLSKTRSHFRLYKYKLD